MNTAIKNEEEKREYFDSEEELFLKAAQLAEWIKDSRHFVAFTGAGISTSAGVPDFRSGVKTKVETGPGTWEKMAQKVPKEKLKDFKRVSTLQAIPTKTHMALVKLIEVGRLKYIISQNVDGLHRRSGVTGDKIAELHGNTNLERCSKCQREYFRDFRVRNSFGVHDHKTGRICEDPKCQGILMDTIINFKESLPDIDLFNGFEHSRKADLHLVLGSSLRVNPAAEMPAETVDCGGRLVIVNIQKTPLDPMSLRIGAFTDKLMEKVMDLLGYEIPKFTLKRLVEVSRVKSADKNDVNGSVRVRGVDEFGNCYSFLKKIHVEVEGNSKKTEFLDPFEFGEKCCNLKNSKILIICHFHGHYGEGPTRFKLELETLKETALFSLVFHPEKQEWEPATRIY